MASADIIWEPENNFYNKHASECEPMFRDFTANASKDFVTLWESPGSQKKVATYKNGVTFWIRYTYTDKYNFIWGFYYENSHSNGWLHMNDLEVVYDNISFMEEHESELKEYNGEYDNSDLGYATIWSYPGSGVITSQISDLRSQLSDIKYIYTDADNRQWAYFPGRIKNSSGFWICASDPTNIHIPAADENQPTIQPASKAQPISVPENRPSFLIMTGAVVVLIAVTAILIRKYWKKDKAGK
jgi:hypothetical protein